MDQEAEGRELDPELADPKEKLVLLVDDDESLLDLMEHVVQKEGFRTDRAMDGTEALRKAVALSPDLLVLDFMLPGMGHCGGGEGPNVFDKVDALEQWVEHSKAPEKFIASHSTNGKVDRTRPLCPYPQVAKYKGTGSIDDAANFVCGAP